MNWYLKIGKLSIPSPQYLTYFNFLFKKFSKFTMSIFNFIVKQNSGKITIKMLASKNFSLYPRDQTKKTTVINLIKALLLYLIGLVDFSWISAWSLL